MIRYAIIDDEPIAHRILENYCQGLSQLNKVANCFDALSAINLLQQQHVDLLFLDIHMPKLSGLDLLKTLTAPPAVIVTSAHQEYALLGYEFEVTDYLLKPFSLARFLKAINKLRTMKSPPTPAIEKEAHPLHFVKADKKYYRLQLEDVLWIEAYGNYCKYYLPDQVITIPQKISEAERALSAQAFIRVHKSYLVAKHHIDSIQGRQILIQEHCIPIGQTYRRSVLQFLQQFDS